MENMEFKFKSFGDGTCQVIEIVLNGDVETLRLPERGPEGETVTGIDNSLATQRRIVVSGADSFDKIKLIRSVHIPASYERVDKVGFYDFGGLLDWEVDPENRSFASRDGLLYSADGGTLISCPVGRRGEVRVPPDTVEVGENAFSSCLYLKKVYLPESVERIGPEAFYMTDIEVYISNDRVKLHDRAFDSEFCTPCIYARRGSAAHRFAMSHEVPFVPWEDHPVWDARGWRAAFDAAREAGDGRTLHALRRDVWLDTLKVVENAGYNLPDGGTVALELGDVTKYCSRFYGREFHAAYFPLKEPVEIRVVPEDCLDVARAWVQQGIEPCVLNMANRQNPGGGVTGGAGAQEEYLFRCSDYLRSLYRYAPYAGQYGLDRARHSYPMDRSFGGIYSPSVTVFRGNEEGGYAYLERPFSVNMIAVAGMNRPELEYTGRGEARIAQYLVEPVKNKIRTVLRIAQDNGQRNLILGALGCGAFRNPPRHVAELFREVLCEDEFDHAFRRVTFAVKTDHNSNGSANFDAFRHVLDGFVPHTDPQTAGERAANIKKIAVSRENAALLRDDGSVRIVNLYKGTETVPMGLHRITDIAAGFNAVFGMRKDGEVRVWNAVGEEKYASRPGFLGRRVPGSRLAATEGHMAVLTPGGDVLSAEGDGFEFEPYAAGMSDWHDMADVALTFCFALGLRRDGTLRTTLNRLSARNRYLLTVPKAKRIAANGAYYGTMTVAVLTEDGRIRTFFAGDPGPVLDGADVVKLACCDGAVFVLDGRGVLRRANRNDTRVLMENVLDFACGLCDAVAIDRSGRLHRFERQ